MAKLIIMILLVQGAEPLKVAVYRDMDVCLADAAKAQQTGTPDTRKVHAEIACIDITGGTYLKGFE